MNIHGEAIMNKWMVVCGLLIIGAGIQAGATDPAKGRDGTDAIGSSSGNETVVYYFYTTQRCPSCLKIEKYTRAALESEFAQELKDGIIVWKMVNVDEPENAHFMDDFKLFTKSVVLVQTSGDNVGRWKNLPKIWQLLNDQSEFTRYITDEVTAFTGEE
jgi:thiol-disulfide isomerase/thioredoxin